MARKAIRQGRPIPDTQWLGGDEHILGRFPKRDVSKAAVSLDDEFQILCAGVSPVGFPKAATTTLINAHSFGGWGRREENIRYISDEGRQSRSRKLAFRKMWARLSGHIVNVSSIGGIASLRLLGAVTQP